MNKTSPEQTINFSSPANVRIEVNGIIDEGMSDYLGGLTISHYTTPYKAQISCLEGTVLDQAALIGILNTLYEMRFTIFKLEIIGNSGTQGRDSSSN